MMKTNKPGQSQKILIVDDKPENLLVLRRVLADIDAEIIDAGNGNDALRASLSHHFALAILDIMMPGMDGYELATLLRSDPRTQTLPIIFLTAAANEDAQVYLGYESGAVDYIVKPYNPNTLLAKVRVFLELDRKNAELEEKVQALAIAEENYRSLVSTVPDIIYRIDQDGRFTFLNDAIRTLGYSPSQLLGSHFSEIMQPEHAETSSRTSALAKVAGKTTGANDTPRLFDERRRGDRRTQGLQVNLRPNLERSNADAASGLSQQYICSEVNSTGIYSVGYGKHKPEFLGTVGVIRDITEHKELMHALTAAKEQADQANRAKSVFLANMSHEIRSPMNAMLGLFYLLEQQPLGGEARELLRKVRNSGQSLLAVINGILDFSKIESGNMLIETAPFRLYDILDNVATLMSTNVWDKNIELIINPSPFACNNLTGDGLKLQQTLVNLTSNAIKFTEAGEVELTVAATEKSEDGAIRLKFSVRDTGIGIAEEQQNEMFAAFSQADNTIGRRFGGTGLGLAISRQLIELMGGTLHVDSKPGQGSTFWFELTFQSDASAAARPASETGTIKLLLAENNDATRTAIANTAKALGWTMDGVGSDRFEFASAMQSLLADKSYAAFLLDWKMPELDCLATAKFIKETIAKDLDQSKLPILMTVSAFERDQLMAQKSIEYVDLVLTKPVTPTSLHNAVLSVLNLPVDNDGLTQDFRPENLQLRLDGIRVLLVDDCEINREIAQSILTLHGASVNLSEDGQSCIDWLEKNPSGADIVLMDVQMPRLDGYETTRRIRRDARWSWLPVVALTAGIFTQDFEHAREAGMDGYIAKPFDVGQMVAIIQFLTGRAAESSSGQPGIDGKTSTASVFKRATDAAEITVKPLVIDVREGIRLYDNVDLYFESLANFVKYYAHAGRDIASLISKGASGKASVLAHKLKGSACYLALVKILSVANELEARLLTGSATENLPWQLQHAIDETIHEIELLTGKGLSAYQIAHPTQPDDQEEPELSVLLETLLEALEQGSFAHSQSALWGLKPKISLADFLSIAEKLMDSDFNAALILAQGLRNQCLAN